MNIAVIPSYQFTVYLPVTSGYNLTCDTTTLTCDSTWTVDYTFIPFTKNNYTLPDYVLSLLCDSTYTTVDNLITSDTI